jgi:hypothetical protein
MVCAFCTDVPFYGYLIMRKYEPNEIGYYGKPITALTREELLEAFAELAGLIHECVITDKKIEELILINKQNLDDQ